MDLNMEYQEQNHNKAILALKAHSLNFFIMKSQLLCGYKVGIFRFQKGRLKFLEDYAINQYHKGPSVALSMKAFSVENSLIAFHIQLPLSISAIGTTVVLGGLFLHYLYFLFLL